MDDSIFIIQHQPPSPPPLVVVRLFVFMLVMLMITTGDLKVLHLCDSTDACHGMFICVHASYAYDHYRG